MPQVRPCVDCGSGTPSTRWARTNNTPMTQAVQAAELSAAKPRTQGEMDNKTPRMREIPLKDALLDREESG